MIVPSPCFVYRGKEPHSRYCIGRQRATGAAERQDLNSRGWSAATPGIKIVRPMPRRGMTIARWCAIVAPQRGFCWFLLATGGFRCAPPPAIRVTPLRGGLSDDSRHTAHSLMRRSGNASGSVRDLEPSRTRRTMPFARRHGTATCVPSRVIREHREPNWTFADEHFELQTQLA